MPDRSLIILIPAYNEEARLPPVLVEYVTFFRRHYQGPFQIVVVANGCRDRTVERVEEIGRDHPEVRALVFPNPIGKGGALIEGLNLASEAEFIGFVDADGATGPESFIKLVRRCVDTDCVVGSRRVEGSVIHQLQPTNRILASRVYHVIVECLFHMRIKDTQCGAKVMTREAAKRIHSSLHIADMAFDVNLLLCLKREGFSIVEAPVEWTDQAGTTVSYFRTSMAMFTSVVRLRLLYSPFRWLLRLMRPLEAWIYKKLRNPLPAHPDQIPRSAPFRGQRSEW